ncbi:MAG: NEAT domain-containing protein [Coriobacteriales bacterium]|nr:NEAT domain-containing protein [Coriobacteriales bacterium]
MGERLRCAYRRALSTVLAVLLVFSMTGGVSSALAVGLGPDAGQEQQQDQQEQGQQQAEQAAPGQEAESQLETPAAEEQGELPNGGEPPAEDAVDGEAGTGAEEAEEAEEAEGAEEAKETPAQSTPPAEGTGSDKAAQQPPATEQEGAPADPASGSEVDTTALVAALGTAAKIDGGLYTKTSFQALSVALATAQSVCDSADATQESIDAQLSLIQQAVDGLVQEAPTKTGSAQVKALHLTSDTSPTPLSALLEDEAPLEEINGFTYATITLASAEGSDVTKITDISTYDDSECIYASPVAINVDKGTATFKVRILNDDVKLRATVPLLTEPQVARLRLTEVIWDDEVSHQSNGFQLLEESDNSPAVAIADINLKKALLDALGATYTDDTIAALEITENQMASLAELNAPNRNITDVTGLRYAVNLEILDLSGNPLGGSKRGTVNFGDWLTTEIKSLVKLKSVNFSNCSFGDNYIPLNTASDAAKAVTNRQYDIFYDHYRVLLTLPAIEELDLSDNDTWGNMGFTWPPGVASKKLKRLDLSGNKINSFGSTFSPLLLPSIEWMDVRDNYLHLDESDAGGWYQSLFQLGDKVISTPQKNLADSYKLVMLNSTATDLAAASFTMTWGIDSQQALPTGSGEFVIEQPLVGDHVRFGLLTYAYSSPVVTVDDNTSFDATHFWTATKSSSSQMSLGTLSGLEPGTHEVTLKVAHPDGVSERSYTLRFTTLALPGGADSDLAGVTDQNVHNAVVAALKLDPAKPITKEDMASASLTALTLTSAKNLDGLEYATSLKTLTASDASIEQVKDFPPNLASLALGGSYTELPAFPETLTSLTLKGNNYNFDEGKILAFPVSLTSLSLNGQFTAPPAVSDLTKLKSLYVYTPCLASPIVMPETATLKTLHMSAAADGSWSDITTLTGLTLLKFYYAKKPIWPVGMDAYVARKFINASTVVNIGFVNPCDGLEIPVYTLVKDGQLLATGLNIEGPGVEGDANLAVTVNLASASEVTNTFTVGTSTSFAGTLKFKGSSSKLTSIKTVLTTKVLFDEDFAAANLTILDFGSAEYDNLDAALPKMPAITAFTVRSDLPALPTNVGMLQELVTLTASQSSLASLDVDLHNCSKLTKLVVNTTDIAVLDVSKLPSSLTELNAQGSAKLTRIVGSFEHLTNLTNLNFSESSVAEFPDGIRYLTGLKLLNASGAFYGDIPANVFDNLHSLTSVYLGNWIPVYRDESGTLQPLPGSSTATAIATLRKYWEDHNITNGKIEFSQNDNWGLSIALSLTTGAYAGLTKLEVQDGLGTFNELPYRSRNLTLQLPKGSTEVTLIPTALMADTTITTGGTTCKSGDSITLGGLKNGSNSFTLTCFNAYQNPEIKSPQTVTYTINVVVGGKVVEGFIPGHYYQVAYQMNNAASPTRISMSNDYFSQSAIVRLLDDGRYEVRTAAVAKDVTWVGYPTAGSAFALDYTQAAKLGAPEGIWQTWQLYAPTLDKQLSIRMFPVPMGVYKIALMTFDLSSAFDVTSNMGGVDVANLQAALSSSESYLASRIYTAASKAALQAAADAARELLDEGNATQAEVDAAAKAVNDAIAALVIDQSKLANKQTLEARIAEAKALEKGSHTDTAWNALQESIADAQAVFDTLDATQAEVDAVTKALTTAITLFKSSGEASKLDPANLADGTYTLNADMIQINRTSYSMSNDAIDHDVTLTVSGGSYYVTVAVKGIYVEGFEAVGNFGYLSRLKYYGTGFSYDANGNPVAKGADGLIPATVLSYQKNADGSYVTDLYNNAQNPYPRQLRFPLVNKTGYEGNFVPLQVFVPIMDAISPGSGTQDVLMRLDWTALKAATGSSTPIDRIEDPGTTKPPTISADKAALKAKIKQAKAISKGSYTDVSWDVLKTAIATAEGIAGSSYVTQSEVDAQTVALTNAINGLTLRPKHVVSSKTELAEDTKYEVRVDLWHATQNRASMGDGSLNHTALVEMVGDQMYMSVSVHPMQVGTIVASLISLQVKQANGSYAYADVIARNIAGNKPSAFRFALPSRDTFIPVRVDPQVAVMGDEPVDARLRISWDTLVKVSADAKVSQNTSLSIGNVAPGSITTVSPAASLADEATGITVEAEANVLPEGTTLKAEPIDSGSSFDLAKSALAEVGSNFVLYDLTLLGIDGSDVQPNGSVKVTLPLPAGMDASKVAVYRINDDGTKTLIVHEIVDDKVVFLTNHFSLYAIVERDASLATLGSTAAAGTTLADAAVPLAEAAEAIVQGGPAWLWMLCIALGVAFVGSTAAGVIINRRLKAIVTGGGQ